MHVAEFTLHAKPGHFDEVAELYSKFGERFLSSQEALETVLILGDEAAGTVRGDRGLHRRALGRRRQQQSGVRGLQRRGRAAARRAVRAGRAAAAAQVREVAARPPSGVTLPKTRSRVRENRSQIGGFRLKNRRSDRRYFVNRTGKCGEWLKEEPSHREVRRMAQGRALGFHVPSGPEPAESETPGRD